MDELVASNYVCHLTGGGGLHGPEGWKQAWATDFSAFPDYHIAIEDMVGEGDKVATRYTLTGTHKGEFHGIAPTGKRFTMSSIMIDRIVGGEFVEGWLVYDVLGMRQQLGIIPTPGQG